MLGKLNKQLGIKRKPIGVFHEFILQKFRKKNGENSDMIKRKVVSIIMARHTISSRNQKKFLQEMQQFRLIELKDKQNIKLLK